MPDARLPARNLLGEETSPYLLQHRDNPVHWRAWGPETLAESKATNKPILLSVGYAACHWCHVMAHESFEDEATAALMNELFVNIKVDREERPDIDAIYQHALALLGQQGGWPLTMFLLPDGRPFWGGTYFPPTSRYGRAAFPDVLRGIDNLYRSEPDKILQNAEGMVTSLAKLSTPPAPKGTLDLAAVERIAARLVRQVDPFHGGVGDAPKFPSPSLYQLLWQSWKRTGLPPYRDAVLLTMSKMSQGGIYDHLGGGFARYSTDERWLAPHFEKMLYDNAQIVSLLLELWRDTREPLYAARIAETIVWLLREMVTESGAFASTIDADSEGEEGKFYVWDAAEIDRLLGDAAPLFKRHYDVSPHGNWEEKTILNRSARPEFADAETEAKLAHSRALLLQARDNRVRPGLDDKVLSDWNGLMITALAEAARTFGIVPWLDAARRAFAAVVASADDDRLPHSLRDGRRTPGTLDDYADMGRAAFALWEATGDAQYLDRARRWVAVADAHFWDASAGGYFFTADDTETLIVRTRTVVDNAVPAGNGVMLQLLARLHAATGEDVYRQRAEALVAAFAGEVERTGYGAATLLIGLETLVEPIQIVVTGEAGAEDAQALMDAAYQRSVPSRVLSFVPKGATLPASHPAIGKGPVGGRATVYVCRGPVCSAPLTEAQALMDSLAAP